MLRTTIIIALLITSSVFAKGQAPADNKAQPIRIEGQASKGFTYPYYLYVPAELKQTSSKTLHTILVLPNNTAKLDDSLAVHEADVKRRMVGVPAIAARLKVAVLMPVFPRPATDWKIYTHALDRDSMVTDKREYARFDLQLIAMIDDARERMKSEKLKFDKRVLLNGFSAQAMFANRFTFLHPGRVKAAVIGSPGGWPIAPVEDYKGKSLRYPIGVGDFKKVAGKSLDIKTLRKVPLFIFLGDKDDNDSVIFGDSYDDEDKELILPLFGSKPVDRWEISKALYQSAKLNAEFKMYPETAHTVSQPIRDDILAFLSKYK